ncbi:MAG: sodium-dependent transporter, partial [Pseudomonadales bacterium]|nr:sodium-dependent transporter [Pseudomonadales bacterium]
GKYNLSQDLWSSRLAFIFAATGFAVGLGNIWKFPYMVGENGGAAFVLIYLACIILVGIPILKSEMLIGRRGGQSPNTSFADLARKEDASPRWSLVGIAGAFACFVVLSFYSVVGGWSIYYLVNAITQTIGNDQASVVNTFEHLLSQDWQANVMYHSIFLALVALVVLAGIRRGIERAVSLIMPVMFVILLVLLAYAASLPGFADALSYMFKFDLQSLAYNEAGAFSWGRLGQVALSALGHSFFTLSVGFAVMVTYAAHLPKSVSIPNTAFVIGAVDTLVALVAGVAIYAIVFSDQALAANAGPGLVFMTVPQAFLNIPGGYWLAILFFLLLWFAAWTSALSLLEPPVEVAMSVLGLNRKVATLLVTLMIWGFGLISALSYNVLSDTTIGGEAILDFLSNLSDKVLLPLTGLLIAIFSGWVMGMNSTTKELGGWGLPYIYWRVCVRVIAPVAIIIIFIAGVKDWLFA